MKPYLGKLICKLLRSFLHIRPSSTGLFILDKGGGIFKLLREKKIPPIVYLWLLLHHTSLLQSEPPNALSWDFGSALEIGLAVHRFLNHLQPAQLMLVGHNRLSTQ